MEKLLQWSLANGLVMYPPGFATHSASNAPITLFPTPFPKDLFLRAIDVQKSFNSLYANVVSHQKSWLMKNIQVLAGFDREFTGRLYETYLKTLEANGGQIPQPLTLGVFRSDYMHDEVAHEIKQIEFNTVLVSFGGLSSKVGKAHTYLNESGSYDNDYSNRYYASEDIPISTSSQDIANGLYKASVQYDERLDTSNSVILFVVQPNERNCFDQRLIEYEILEKYNVKSYRLTLEQIESHTTINQGRLYIKSTMDEVSVVYFRSGYSPLDYEMDPELTWKARLILESAKAIKCPSLLTQLSGSKKVQQMLTEPEVLKQFLPGAAPDLLQSVMSTFVKIHPLDDSDAGQQARKLALESPKNFVLKPQREGGGNNIYKENIPAFLKSLNDKDWGAYILMELIHPPTHSNNILRNSEIFEQEIISELGIFGNILFNEDTGEVLFNDNAGFLLRSKFSSSDEGGVAAGFGCVDNVYLY